MNNQYYKKAIFVIKHALSHELEQDIAIFNSVAPDDHFLSESTDKKIRAMISRIPVTSPKSFAQQLRRIAIIVLVSLTTTVVTAMCIPSVRASVLTFFETAYDRYIGIYWDIDSEEDCPTTIEAVLLPHLPTDWSIESIFENPYLIRYNIFGINQETILFSQYVYKNDITYAIDNDPLSTETVYLNDIPATLYTYSDGTQILLWTDRYVFTMTAFNTSRETLLALAESVSEQK